MQKVSTLSARPWRPWARSDPQEKVGPCCLKVVPFEGVAPCVGGDAGKAMGKTQKHFRAPAGFACILRGVGGFPDFLSHWVCACVCVCAE